MVLCGCGDILDKYPIFFEDKHTNKLYKIVFSYYSALLITFKKVKYQLTNLLFL